METKIYDLVVVSHTGLLLGWIHKSRHIRGTYEECRTFYKKVQMHNLLFGWWSILSLLFMNWAALYESHKAMKQLDSLAEGTNTNIPRQ